MAEQIANIKYCNELGTHGNPLEGEDNLCVTTLIVKQSDRVTFVSYPSRIYTDNQLVRKCDIVATQAQIIERMNPKKITIYNKTSTPKPIPASFRCEITIEYSYQWEANGAITTSTITGLIDDQGERSIYAGNYETFDIIWTGGIPENISIAHRVELKSFTISLNAPYWMRYDNNGIAFRFYRKYQKSSGSEYSYVRFIGTKNLTYNVENTSGDSYESTWVPGGTSTPLPGSAINPKEIFTSLYNNDDGWIIGLAENPSQLNDD